MTMAPTDSPEGLRPPGGRPRDEDRRTRKPLAFWDRVKFLLLLTVFWFILLWATKSGNPLVTWSDAFRIEARSGAWVLVLIGLEVLRQIHFLISEHWAGYHYFWTHRVFGGTERVTHRKLSDWTRFRLWRLITWVFWIAVLAVMLGRVKHTTPVDALFNLPGYVWSALPFVLQIMTAIIFIVIQFAALFWFLSRGGVDVYCPDDIKTRFTDVWGQDHVLERVKENILYLEDPEQIESRGGYVPGGILLWGPPGTGKTLMAEAGAGETGRPYVFVDPGAFINMFMGVGILKVKSLFRKLCRLALRYGGLIVFFDEADSLGRRGALAQGGPNFPGGGRATPAAWQAGGCHGFSYLSDDVQWRLARRALSSSAGEEPDTRRNKQMMGMGMGMGGGGGMGTLEALLTELSGLKKPRGFVNRNVRRLLGLRPKPPPKYRMLVMMAGPGAHLRGLLLQGPARPTAEQVDKLATITPYATGATIKDLVNEVLITAIRAGRDVITWGDVIRAKQLKELGPPEDVGYIERERHAVAIHEACHALVAYRTRQHMEIDIATIEKGSDYLGMVASIPPEDQFTRWRSEYETDILVSLASLAGERMFFNDDSSSGVSGELESATTVASFMEGFWGMGSTVSSYSSAKRLEVGSPGGGQGGRNKKGQDPEAEMRRALADRIEDNLNALLGRVEEIINENRAQVLSLAHALETYKTLTGEDVVAVIERRPGPFVDGRPYADPGLIELLEDYHRGAAVAHHEHSHIPLGMPEIPRPVLTAPGPGGWLVAPDPDPLNSREHGNGSGPASGPGASGPTNGAPPNGAPPSWPGPDGGP